MLSRKMKGGCSKDPFGGQFEDLKCLELNDNEGSDVVEPFGDPKMYFSPLISYEPEDSYQTSSSMNYSRTSYFENNENRNKIDSNGHSDTDSDNNDNIMNEEIAQSSDIKSNGKLRVRLLFQNSHYPSQPDGIYMKEKDRRTGAGSFLDLADGELIHYIGKV